MGSEATYVDLATQAELDTQKALWSVIAFPGGALPTAATTGDYVQTAAVGSTVNGAISEYMDWLTDSGSTFRLKTKFYCAQGAADPTGTITFSLYVVTTSAAAAGAGIVYTLGAQVASSVVSQASPVRGTVYALTSATFSLSPSTVYAVNVNLAGANLPALVVTRTFHQIQVHS